VTWTCLFLLTVSSRCVNSTEARFVFNHLEKGILLVQFRDLNALNTANKVGMNMMMQTVSLPP
jgi:hypothetical protein